MKLFNWYQSSKSLISNIGNNQSIHQSLILIESIKQVNAAFFELHSTIMRMQFYEKMYYDLLIFLLNTCLKYLKTS